MWILKKTKAGNCIKSKFQNLICTIVNPGKVHWIQTQSFWRHHRSATHSTVLTDSLYMHTLLYLTAQIQTSQLLRSALQLSHRTVLWLCTWFNLHDSTAPSPHFFYKHDLKKKKTKTALQTVCPCIFLKYIHIIFEVRQLTLNSFLCFVSSQRLCLYIMQYPLLYPTYITFNWLFLFWSQQYLPICLSLIPESNI